MRTATILCLILTAWSCGPGVSVEDETGGSTENEADLRKKADGGARNPGKADAGLGGVDAGVADAGSAVSFAQVQAIFDAHCVGCHQPDVMRGGMSLVAGQSYGQLVNQSAATVSSCAGFGSRVLPGNVQASLLSQKVHGTQHCGMRMPASDSRIPVAMLPEADQATIDAWIAAGAPAH